MKKFLAFSFAALFLSACGDDASTSFTAASGTLTAAIVTANSATLSGGVVPAFTGAPTNSPSGVREDDDLYSTCTTKSPTTEVDADSDQIKTQTRTYKCTGIAHGNGTNDRNGTATVTDKDDNDALSGFKFAYDMTGAYKQTARSQTNNYSYKGFWELTKDTTTITHTSDFRGYSDEVRDGVTDGGTYGGTWRHLEPQGDPNRHGESLHGWRRD